MAHTKVEGVNNDYDLCHMLQYYGWQDIRALGRRFQKSYKLMKRQVHRSMVRIRARGIVIEERHVETAKKRGQCRTEWRITDNHWREKFDA